MARHPVLRSAAPSRRSRTTRSCPTARRARWSRRTGRSSGCACRGWTRRRSSARSSTATPGISGSGRPTYRVPAARRYLPGTMVLETSWGTSSGWIIVRDLLLIGPWHHETERSHTHRRSPTDYDADHVLLRTMRCVNGEVQVNLDCEPVFDYGRVRGDWEYTGAGYHEGVCRAPGGGHDVELKLTTDMNLGLRGPARHRAHADQGGPDPLLRPRVVRAPRAADLRRGLSAARLDRSPLAALARPRPVPRPPVARTPAAERADAEGAVVRADRGADRGRRRRRCPRRPAASATGTTATRGSATPRSCCGASTRSASTGRRTTSSTSSPTWPRRRRASSRSCTGSTARRSSSRRRSTTCRATRARGRSGSATARTTRTSTTCGARCSTRSTSTRSRATRCPSGCGRSSRTRSRPRSTNWRDPDRGLWEVRGEPKHFTSSKLMCWVALDRGARLAEIREELDLAAQWQQIADEIKADICENGTREDGVFTQHYDTDALDASVLLMPLVRFLPPDDERICATVRAVAGRAHPGRARPALPGRRDRRRAERGGGDVHDLLLLARIGAVRDRRPRAGARPVREAPLVLVGPRPVRGGDRPAAPGDTSATSRRRSRTSR